MSQTPAPNDSKDIHIETEGDATIGSFVGGDSTTNNITHIEGGPTARSAIFGIALVAVVAIMATLLAVLWPRGTGPAASNTPTFPPTTQAPSLPAPTSTPAPTATKAHTETPVPIVPTNTPTAPATAIAYFQDNCIPAALWNAFPRASSLGACLSLTGFLGQADGLVIRKTQSTSGERQQGIYLPLTGNATISFTLTLNQLQSKNERTNLSFGIVNTTNGFSYVNGAVYLCYFSVRGSLEPSAPIYLNPGDSLCVERPAVRALTFETPQAVTFSLRSGRLTITVNGQPVFDDFLAFTSRAFYVGYDAHDEAEITAILSQFTVTLDD